MKSSYRRDTLPLVLIIILYLLLVGRIALRLPVFASPNESGHYEVVALLHQSGHLPDPATSQRADERHQPPLYYLTAGAVAFAMSGPTLLDTELEGNPHFGSTHIGNLNPKIHANWRNVPLLYVGRMVSALFGVLGILGLWLACRTFSTQAIRLLAVGLFAFHPMVLFLSASLSNDLPVAAMAALLLGYSTTLILEPRTWRSFALWGVLMALALLTKASAIFLIVLLPFLCLAQWQHSRTFRPVLYSFLAALSTFALCWLVWILYNLQRGLDLLGVERSVRLAELIALRPCDLPMLYPYLPVFWQAFTLDWSVGGVGFGPTAFYWIVAVGVVIGLAGWFWAKPRGQERLLVAMHATWIVPVVLLYLASNLIVLRAHDMTVAEGRLLLIILPSLAWLIAGGWQGWWLIRWRGTSLRWRNNMAWGILGIWALTAVWLAGTYLPWLYPRMTEVPATAGSNPQTTMRYEEKLALNDLSIPERLTVGELTPVALTWEALDVPRDYTISLQLLEPLNPHWRKLESQNSYPGLGMNPTSEWVVGTHYRDRFYVRPVGDLNGPTLLHVVVWVLDGASDGDALTATRAGEIQDPPIAHSIVVAPATPLVVPAGAQVNRAEFGNQIALIGLEKEKNKDGSAALNVYWQAMESMPEDYTFFVHWLDATGKVVAQSDAMPNQGLSPTSIWHSGDVVRDHYSLPVAEGALQSVRLGVYRAATMERLPAYQDDNRLIDDTIAFPLQQIPSTHD